MPFHEIDGDSYLAVTKVYVNSTDDRGDGTNSRFRVQLNTELRDVVSVELTGFAMPRSVAPTVPASSSYVDFHVIEDGLTRYDYSFQIPKTAFTIDTLSDYLADTMDDLVSDEIKASLYYLVTPNDNNVLEFILGWADDFNTYTWGLDFKTGPNAANSAYAQLGFEQEDYTSTVRSLRQQQIDAVAPASLSTFRYVDITLEEVPELQPIKRIFIGDTADYTLVNQEVAPRTRIITNTERSARLRHITVNASLAGGEQLLDSTYDLEFTIYNLEATENVPEWVQESFLL